MLFNPNNYPNLFIRGKSVNSGFTSNIRIMPIHIYTMYSHITCIVPYLVECARILLVCTRMLLVCTRMLLVGTRMLLVGCFCHDAILKQFTFQSPKFLQSFINNNKRRSLYPCLGASTSGSIPTAVVGEAERDCHNFFY